MKTTSNSQTNNDRAGRPGRSRKPVQRDANEVMAELVARLSQKLEAGPEKTREAEGRQEEACGPNRDRLTVGVDLEGLEGEKLTEGELPTTQQDSRNSSRCWRRRE
jgi:hypothetical protein